MLVVQVRVYRQKLHRGDAQVLDVLEYLRLGQAGESAAHRFGYLWIAHRVAAHMGFVDDRFIPRLEQAGVVSPVVGVFDHHALGHEGRAIALVEAQVAVGVAHGVAVELIGPDQIAVELARIRIQ